MNNIKTAILQVADTGPLESIVVMLRSIGIQSVLSSASLRHELRNIGCDCVLDIDRLVSEMGYDAPMPLPVAGIPDMLRSDVLFVDIKAQKNLKLVTDRWPNLTNRVLWYRINGGKPEHVVNKHGDHGDETNPGCPILTPNQWYAGPPYRNERGEFISVPWKAYTCWPPFHRFNDYDTERESKYQSSICLVHNVEGWGYTGVINRIREEYGVKCHGHRSPDGLIQHREVKVRLTNALAMVHIKSSDAPGYALYEALASACPIIVTRKLIWKNRMEELLIDGKTCLVIEDGANHDGVESALANEFVRQVGIGLGLLRDPVYNRQIGEAGKAKLRELMWGDAAGLRKFMETNYA